MRDRWLGLILRLTNDIYRRKKLLREQEGWRIIANVAALVCLEIGLGLVSLPLYINMKSSGVTAFFADTGEYAKVDTDYNIRRVLTLTGVSIFVAIWALKLVFIVAVPRVYGELPLYTVSDFRPADIELHDVVVEDTDIQTAKVVPDFPVPTITDVQRRTGGSYVFSGQGQAGTSVVLLLSDRQTALYTGITNEQGNWQVTHEQESFKLRNGNRSVVVFSYDEKSGTRSPAAPEQFFRVTPSWVDGALARVDVLANWSVLLLIALGAFLTFLTIE